MVTAPASRANLRILLNWCRLQAGKPDADPLWQRIADEIAAYLGDEVKPPAPPPSPDGLF